MPMMGLRVCPDSLFLELSGALVRVLIWDEDRGAKPARSSAPHHFFLVEMESPWFISSVSSSPSCRLFLFLVGILSTVSRTTSQPSHQHPMTQGISDQSPAPYYMGHLGPVTSTPQHGASQRLLFLGPLYSLVPGSNNLLSLVPFFTSCSLTCPHYSTNVSFVKAARIFHAAKSNRSICLLIKVSPSVSFWHS